MTDKILVLDHGFVALRNLAGPTRRDGIFDADDTDPAYAKAVDKLLRTYLPATMDLYDQFRRLP